MILKGNEVDKCITFKDYVGVGNDCSNKVGFLIECFKRLHNDAPKDDFDNLNGKMAKIWSMLHKDTAYTIKLIWDTSSASIVGSHVNYIFAIANRNAKQVGVASKAGIHKSHSDKLERLSKMARGE